MQFPSSLYQIKDPELRREAYTAHQRDWQSPLDRDKRTVWGCFVADVELDLKHAVRISPEL